MKKIGIICSAFMLFGVASANAQGILDKIDRTLNKADKVENQADRASKTSSKIGDLFGKKKAAAAAETETIINVSGVDFATLKNIAEKAENTKGVASAKTKFSTSASTISLQHAGTTDDLLQALQKTNPSVFAEKNIEAFEEGEISIKLAK